MQGFMQVPEFVYAVPEVPARLILIGLCSYTTQLLFNDRLASRQDASQKGIAGAIDGGLVYSRVDKPCITYYSDADYAGDQENRRSTSGLISFLSTAPISFKSQQQTSVAISTAEAEYVACTLAVKELIWLERFVKELKIPVSPIGKLFCDNQSAIRLMKNPEFHDRTKHIDTRYHFIREQFLLGNFQLFYVPTDQQKADIFTKALPADAHNHLKQQIGCTGG